MIIYFDNQFYFLYFNHPFHYFIKVTHFKYSTNFNNLIDYCFFIEEYFVYQF